MIDDNSITFKTLYDEIIKNRGDLKNTIEASEARVLLKIETVNNKVIRLEKENQQLKDKIEFLERQNKKNGIIIFGIQTLPHEISPEYICQKLNSLLEINLVNEDISDVYSLGKNGNRPVKVELISQLKKRSVIQNSHKLKGKSISIVHDLTITQRQENKILRKHLFIARENEDNCYIKRNKLYINNIPYTAEELERFKEIEEDKTEKRNLSAPPTPNIRNPGNSKIVQEELDDSLIQKQSIHSKEETEDTEEKEIQKNKCPQTPKSTSGKSTTKYPTELIKEKTRTRSTTSQKK